MKVFSTIAMIASLGTGYLGEGSFPHELLLIGYGVYLLAPALFILLLLLGLAAVTRRHHRLLLPAFRIWLVLFVAGWISHAVGRATSEYRKKAVEAFVETTRPILQQHFDDHGAFPEELPGDLERPAWLRNDHSYIGRGDRYEFNYPDPGSLAFGGWIYTSSDHQWHYFD